MSRRAVSSGSAAGVAWLHRKGRHRERAGAMRVEHARGAAAILSHERGQPCHERGQLLGRGQRTLEQRELQHAPGRRLDAHRDPVDPGTGWMRFEIEQRQRSQHAGIANGRRQLQAPHVRLARDQPQGGGEHGRRTAAPLEVRAHGVEQAPEHERQRLESFDGPLGIEVRLEGFLRHERHERPGIFAAGQPLQADAGLAEARESCAGGSAARSPSVRTPHRVNVSIIDSYRARASAAPALPGHRCRPCARAMSCMGDVR